MTALSDALAVLSSITYGAADFLGGLATRRRSTVFAVVVCSQAAGLGLVLLALPFLPASSPAPIDLAWGGAGGLAGGIGLALLYRGLAVGVMSVVAPVTAVCAVIIPVLVGVAMSERLAAIAVLGIALAVAAIVLISQTGHVGEGKRARAGLPTAVVSGISIGVFLVCLERTGPAAGLWPLVAARIVSISLFVLAGIAAKQRLAPSRATLALVLGGGALDMVANILYLLAVRQGSLGIVATLTSLYPASTILLARVVLHERLRPLQQAGVACALVAIVLIVAR
jgi:drug/metabolite transporter (DMT)-like permease